MLDIPFPLATVPAETAEAALAELRASRPGFQPVLLGDQDIFSTEWAEYVDTFEAPDAILAEAREIDVDAWFANRTQQDRTAEAVMGRSVRTFNGLYRVIAFPFDVVFLPIRLASWPLTGRRPSFFTRSPFDVAHTRDLAAGAVGPGALRAQLAEFEAAGEGTAEELEEIRDVIAAMESDGTGGIFPDPVDYVTPRSGGALAAGLLRAGEPWEGAAWLQHGTYAICAPRAVLVAHCKWLWDRYEARIITASTDHIGFEMGRPIAAADEAREVLARFAALGAVEVNGDSRTSSGASLVGARRLWVWWD